MEDHRRRDNGANTFGALALALTRGQPSMVRILAASALIDVRDCQSTAWKKSVDSRE